MNWKENHRKTQTQNNEYHRVYPTYTNNYSMEYLYWIKGLKKNENQEMERKQSFTIFYKPNETKRNELLEPNVTLYPYHRPQTYKLGHRLLSCH